MGSYADNRSAAGLRRIYTDISSALTLATTDTTKTLVADRGSFTTFVQRVIVYVTTDAAQSLAFQDTAGTPVPACKVTTSPGVDTRWDFDFGDRGMPLTQGKGLQVVPSAAGLGAQIEVQGYQKMTGAPDHTVAGAL